MPWQFSCLSCARSAETKPGRLPLLRSPRWKRIRRFSVRRPAGPVSAITSSTIISSTFLVGTVALLALSLISGCASGGTPSATPSAAVDPAATAAAPAVAPTPVCGSSVLNGPATPPAGAVSVSLSQSLSVLNNSSPAGTTFWISPGVHTLGGGIYDQVMPKANNHYIGAPGAIIDGQHLNLYAFTGQATGVIVEHLTIRNFGSPGQNNNQGVVNHDAGKSWTVRYNTITTNAGAGVFMGSNDVVNWNCISNNGQYGFSAYSATGVSNLVLDHNEISGNNADNWEVRSPGCGCSGGGKFWAVKGAKVTNNNVHNNKGVGLWADTNNTGFLFSGNYIASNDNEGLMYEISYNAAITNNTFVRNGIVKGPTNPGFPTGAIYLSESGSDSRVPGSYGASFAITGNVFTNNWSGVVLWENADRFCNSPANSSTNVCTLVAPAENLITNCNASNIAKAPYYSDCRWKTKNVRVAGNSFSFSTSAVGNGCSTATGCGQNALFSNYGSYPSWSPYKGDVIRNAILYQQNNVFANNAYSGPWTFIGANQSHPMQLKAWQAAPFKQDLGSSAS